MSKKFQYTPVALAITLALSHAASAADVEIKAPPGGSVVLRNSDGTVTVLIADSTGTVRIPGLPTSSGASAGVVCYDAAGVLTIVILIALIGLLAQSAIAAFEARLLHWHHRR